MNDTAGAWTKKLKVSEEASATPAERRTACAGTYEQTPAGRELSEGDIIDLQRASPIGNAPDVYANLMKNVSRMFASADGEEGWKRTSE